MIGRTIDGDRSMKKVGNVILTNDSKSMTVREISEKAGTTIKTTYRWLEFLGIEVSCSKKPNINLFTEKEIARISRVFNGNADKIFRMSSRAKFNGNGELEHAIEIEKTKEQKIKERLDKVKRMECYGNHESGSRKCKRCAGKLSCYRKKLLGNIYKEVTA